MNVHDFFRPLLHYHSYFGWRDAAEILFFSAIIYYFCRWLAKDSHKNLVGYFYSYCLLTAVSYTLNISTITHFLILFAPTTLMLFIVFHQFTLQKNFVTLRNIVPATPEKTDWLETLVRSCLISISNNKELVCIIEHSDSLSEHISTPLALHAPLSKELLDIVFTSNSFDQYQMLWLDSQGNVLGVNAQWKETADDFAAQTAQGQRWKHDALLYTEKTDAIVFKVTPASHSFDIVAAGTVFEKVNAANTLTFIGKYLRTSTPGEFIHANKINKTYHQRSS